MRPDPDAPGATGATGDTLALTALAFALRLGWGLAVRVPPAWDGELYERGARAIAAALGYSCFMFGPGAMPRVPTAYYPVGYPAFLGALYAVFGVHPWVVAAGGALVSAATVALAHRLARRVASPRAAVAAALVLALAPGQVIFASTPMTEPLWGFLLALAVWLLARRAPALPWAHLAAAAVALAAAVYVRPQAVLLAPVLPLLPPGTPRVRLARAAAATAVVLACVAPWTARNCRALDGCAFVSTNGGGNLAIGALPGAAGTFRFLTPADGCRDVGRGTIREVARDACWRAAAVASIRAAPARWLRLGAAKLHHTYAYEAFPVGYLRAARPDLLDDRGERAARRGLSYVWRALYLLAVLAALPLYPRRALGTTGALCAAAIAVITLTHVVFFGGDRYHLPLAALVAALASGAWRDLPPRVHGPARLVAPRVDPARKLSPGVGRRAPEPPAARAQTFVCVLCRGRT